MALRSFSIIISRKVEGWVFQARFQERWKIVSLVARANYEFPGTLIQWLVDLKWNYIISFPQVLTFTELLFSSLPETNN